MIVARPASPSVGDVLDALAGVHDPEIPTVSLVDLGLVHDVRVSDRAVSVELLPTWVACPALDVIRTATIEAIEPLGLAVEVTFTRAVPWTTDRLTDAGRAGLRAAGIAPPSDLNAVECPFCTSSDVAMDSAFGPTLCRSLFYCRTCRQPFEAFKPV